MYHSLAGAVLRAGQLGLVLGYHILPQACGVWSPSTGLPKTPQHQEMLKILFSLF